MAPDGTTIVDNARYTLENGPGTVRLNFTHTILSDNGIWRCDVRVLSAQDVVSNGSLVQRDLNVIGTSIIHDIQLTIVGKCAVCIILFNACILDLSMYSYSQSATNPLSG